MARLCAFRINSFELRARAHVVQTQQKESSESRKYVSTLYSVHYVKLTLSYAQI